MKEKWGAARSGGGPFGNWYVGCEDYVLTHTDVAYDIEGGVSFGALDAAFHAQYPKDDKKRAIREAVVLFSSVSSRDIWRHRFPLRRLHGLWLSSFYDSRRLQKLVRRLLSVEKLRASGKRLIVGVVNRATGEYRTFTEQDDDIVEAVIASASIPGVFQPNKINGDPYIDGGVHTVTPIKALIDEGCTHIDAYICHPQKPNPIAKRHMTGLESLVRAADIMSSKMIWDDVIKAKLTNELIDAGLRSGKRKVQLRVFHPDSKVGDDPLLFSPDEALRMQFDGYETARKMHEGD